MQQNEKNKTRFYIMKVLHNIKVFLFSYIPVRKKKIGRMSSLQICEVTPWYGPQIFWLYDLLPDPRGAKFYPTNQIAHNYHRTRVPRRLWSASGHTDASVECHSWLRHVSISIQSKFCLERGKATSTDMSLLCTSLLLLLSKIMLAE